MSTWLAVRVIGTFLLLITVFFFVLTYDPILKVVDIGAGLAQLSAFLSYGVLKVIGFFGGFPVHKMHTIMGSGSFEVDVAPACSGAVPTSIYMAAVFAYPSSWRSRLLGAALGIVTIQIVNIIRVSALFLIGLFFHEIFHDTHVYVAQALVVCVAVALWLYWVTRYADAPAH
ncbi:MAG: archaeosortase/exosortase family protein [Candidatus Binatia bacterium]